MREWLKDKLAEIKDDLKRAHTSWTVWFNIVAFPLLTAYWPQIWDAIQQLQPFMPDSKYQILMAVNGVVNVILRFKTTKALRNK